MALLPYSQIGENLYADTSGKQFNITNGNRSYVQSPYDAMTNKLNSLYDNQKNSQLTQLKAQRERAISGYNKQKTELKPVYQNQRNQADVVNAQNVTRLRELMAAQGINTSGENLTTQASMASARQSALGEITGQENQAMGEIDRQIANENDPSRDQAIIDSIETERSSRLAEAYNQYQQQILQQQQAWKAEQFQKEQFEWQKQMEQQQLALSRQRAATTSTRQAKVEKKTKGISYADGLAYWSDQADNIRKQGAIRVEKALRSDSAQLQALQDQGYDIEGVIDALYSVASNGRFENQTAYKKYYETLTKDSY
ncbi:MAG: hypothetical protein K0Q87_84 [Neobacillus sp.]|jgi:hypothetical protein|nr:hypothetical protein [Neobacillus sp.]